MHRRFAGASLPAVGVAGALALALAGCGTSQTSSSTTAPAPPQSAQSTQSAGAPHTAAASCRPGQLALSYTGTEGATGHMELTVAVHNASKAACELRGYPGARLIGAAGRPLPLRVVRGHGFFPDTEPAPRRVALKPGSSAHVGLSFATNNEYKGARVCRTATAAMLSPPGSASHWQRVSLHGPRIAPCGNQLVVSPVHA